MTSLWLLSRILWAAILWIPSSCTEAGAKKQNLPIYHLQELLIVSLQQTRRLKQGLAWTTSMFCTGLALELRNQGSRNTAWRSQSKTLSCHVVARFHAKGQWKDSIRTGSIQLTIGQFLAVHPSLHLPWRDIMQQLNETTWCTWLLPSECDGIPEHVRNNAVPTCHHLSWFQTSAHSERYGSSRCTNWHRSAHSDCWIMAGSIFGQMRLLDESDSPQISKVLVWDSYVSFFRHLLHEPKLQEKAVSKHQLRGLRLATSATIRNGQY